MQRIKELWYKLKAFSLKRRMPKMISSFTNTKGEIIKGTSVSTSTFIDYPHKLSLKDNVYIGHFNFLESSQGITIERGVQITNYVTITTHSSHDSIRLYGVHYSGSEMLAYLKGPILIGEFSFIGPYSTIMPGTKLGKGCLVKAYSFLQGDFPDYSIIEGNPAKVVGSTKERDQFWLHKYPELLNYYYDQEKSL